MFAFEVCLDGCFEVNKRATLLGKLPLTFEI